MGGTWTLGPGRVQFGYGTGKLANTTLMRKIGLGYRHALSKRTTLYTDVARDNVLRSNKSGYDAGIYHTF